MTTADLILVRHAMPVVAADVATEEWPLTPEGCAAAAALGARLPGAAVWVSSTEQKAVETLAHARGDREGDLLADPRFGEVRRPGEPFGGDFRERRRAWVEGRLDARHDGWELPEEAAERFGAGVAAHAGSLPLVVVSHGMVMTAWMVATGRLARGAAAGEWWARLAFPDLVRVDGSAPGR